MSQQIDSFHEGLATGLVRGHEDLMAQLIELRQTKGITQRTVAARMGVTQPTVAAFEAHDSNPTLATLRRYALAVRASITYTVEDADPEGRLTTVI
jgi:transcriptional regulator with XRE-family HTH domain